MEKTKVLVVDDSALIRSLLSRIVNAQPDMETVGAASDPLIARDMIKALKVLKEVGYDGIVQPDHAPHTTGDTEYGHISHAFQIGYLKGCLQGAGALE